MMRIREKLTKLYWEKLIPTINQEQETIAFMLSKEVLEVLLPLYEVTMGPGMSRHVTIKEGE